MVSSVPCLSPREVLGRNRLPHVVVWGPWGEDPDSLCPGYPKGGVVMDGGSCSGCPTPSEGSWVPGQFTGGSDTEISDGGSVR